MKHKLCFEYRKPGFRCRYFVFLDVMSSLSERLFRKSGIKVRFLKAYGRDDIPYIAVYCKVRKGCVPSFMETLEELKNNMLICGYRDYEECIEKYLSPVKG